MLDNEVKLMAALSHRHIVEYRTAWVNGKQLLLFMEYVSRGDLAALVTEHATRQEHFDTGRLLRWAMQLTDALSYMHSQCVLHRDIKTGNIFLTENGDVKVGDFGTSRLLNAASLAITVVGTPYNIAPETLQAGGGVGYRSEADCWSLGTVLFELVTLRKAFEAREITELLTLVTSGTASRPSRCTLDTFVAHFVLSIKSQGFPTNST